MSDRVRTTVRTTVAVDREVLETFRVMAEAAGISVSRCIGEWLADTAESAQLVSAKMVEARRAPAKVMREMQAYARGMVSELNDQARNIRSERGGLRPRGKPAATGPKRPKAPSSNTGLKSSRTGSPRKP